MIEGQADLIRQALSYPFRTIADISGGRGEAAQIFYEDGREVTLTAFHARQTAEGFPADIRVIEQQPITAMEGIADAAFDALWCAHVLEHCQNPGLALAELRRILKPDGYLFLSVPPYKPQLVGGHVSTGWNIASAIYALALAGFDTPRGAYIKYGYNIAAFVPRAQTPLMSPELLEFSKQDIPHLAAAFPETFACQQNIYGDIASCNWQWQVPKALLPWRRRLRLTVRDRLLRLAYSIG